MKRRSPSLIFKSVVFALVMREVKGRFGRVRMGAFWTFLEPLCHILGFTLIFSSMRIPGASGIDFAIFLLVGLAPFLLMKNIALSLMESVESNRSLFVYKQITPFDTFVGRTVVEFLLAAVVYILLILGFAWIGHNVLIEAPLMWMAVIALGLSFAFALGVSFALLVSKWPEAKVIVRLMFLPLYFLSGVVIPPTNLPPALLSYVLWNPFVHVIELLRHAVFDQYVMVEGASVWYLTSVTVVLLFCSLGLYRVNRLKMAAA